MRYYEVSLWDKPFGEVRYTWKSSDPEIIPSTYALTRQTFTDQYSYMDDSSTAGVEGFGLMFYQSRFYDPSLGRFASADSIVPAGVQGYDRYAYVNNNPVNFTDPSGHIATDCGDGDSECSGFTAQDIIDNNKQDAKFRSETERRQCATGNELHCSYAQLHPYETATFVVGSLVGGAAAETAILEGGAVATVDIAVTSAKAAFWKAAGYCISNPFCRWVTGNSFTSTLTVFDSESVGPITPRGVTVIGKFDYYLTLGNNLKANVLDVGRAWSPGVQNAFEQEVIANQHLVIMSTTTRTGLFAKEVINFVANGFDDVYPLLIPPTMK